MLYLTGNSENVIYTDVSSIKELSSPTYLMSLTHSQTGRKWTFIPQNITPQSGTPYNNRYDLFRFDISGGTENLTGATNGWYYQRVPCLNYEDSRYSGTNESYLVVYPIVAGLFGSIQLQHDFSDNNELVTGATMTIGGQTFTPTIQKLAPVRLGNVSLMATTLSGADLDLNGKLEFDYETNSGNTFNKTYYINSLSQVSDAEPWKYYGYDTLTSVPNTILPITHLKPAVVDVDEIGEFRYSIYEQANPINLDTSLTYNQLEVGLAYITEGFTDIFYESSDPSDVYNP